MSERAVRRLAAASLGLGLVAMAWSGWSWFAPEPGDPVASAPPPVATPDRTSTPDRTATPLGELDADPPPGTAAPPMAPQPAPTPAAPGSRVLRLEFPTAGYASDVGTMAVADQGAIKPPDFQHAWWISDRGVLPSSTATDTAYLACHTDAKKSALTVPCNRVSLDNMPTGAAVHVTTDTERLTYTVVEARKVARDAFASDAEVWAERPGRLVWVSCYLSDGRRSGYNIVVIAERRTA